ncbi:MAG: hypothetical protein QXG76_01870 [Candidatus Bathyarchaeia archaeon]
MSQRKLTPMEIQLLREALSSDYKAAGIRLREGEYQYELSKAIADFQLELCFPNVKDLVKKLHGEDKVNDVQFIRKTQTILKKMEKSGVIKILPKSKPWELQRYALLSLKFMDSDKNQVSLATDEQIRKTQENLKSILIQHGVQKFPANLTKIRVYVLAFAITISYAIIVWDLLQPTINPIIIVPLFSLATFCSIMLGKMLASED